MTGYSVIMHRQGNTQDDQRKTFPLLPRKGRGADGCKGSRPFAPHLVFRVSWTVWNGWTMWIKSYIARILHSHRFCIFLAFPVWARLKFEYCFLREAL